MKTPTTRSLARGLAALLAALASAAALAQVYPAKPVVVKVAYPAGGGMDAVTRQVLPALQAALGQTFVAENLAGAGGSIATLDVLRAPGDGYTVLSHTNDVVLTPLALASVRYKLEDLRLVGALGISDLALVARPTIGVESLRDLVQLSKSQPNGLTLANQGQGSVSHLAGEDLAAFSGLRITGVPYKGGAPMLQDLLGGHVDLAFIPVAANSVGMIQQGKIIAIGVAATKRNPALPNVPTLSEGRTDRSFVHNTWGGFFVSSTVPDPVVQVLNRAVLQAVDQPAFRKWADQSGLYPLRLTTKAADEFYKAEARKYTDLAQRANLKPQ